MIILKYCLILIFYYQQMYKIGFHQILMFRCSFPAGVLFRCVLLILVIRVRKLKSSNKQQSKQ